MQDCEMASDISPARSGGARLALSFLVMKSTPELRTCISSGLIEDKIAEFVPDMKLSALNLGLFQSMKSA